MDILKKKYDAIVVGTGPGGATVAKELSAKGKSVLILEYGPGKPVRGTFIQYIMEQFIPGKSLFVTPDLLGMVRGVTTGGSSLFYYGTAFPVPHDMMKKYGINVTEEEKEARREIPIGPLKKEMVTPFAQRIMDSAQKLGYKWKLLDKFMYQDRWRPGQRFGYYGDPNNVKWSSKMYIDEATKSGAVLLNRAKVLNVILEGNKAVGVEFRHKGRRREAYASTIILGAGGIGSPVILRKMGVTEAGYNYFFDPLISVYGKVKGLRKKKEEIPMSAGCVMEDEGIVMTDMAVPFMVDQVFTASSLRPWRLLESRKTMRIMIKIRDELSGRIAGDRWVLKRLSPADREKLRKGAEMAKNILIHAGCRGVHATWKLAAHPGGTVRIGHILDADLKVRGYENLYVCDCAVIPEPWGLPPTLTIVCLGKRLAKYLLAGKKGAARAKQSVKRPAHAYRK